MMDTNFNVEVATGIIDSTVPDGGYLISLYELYADESESGNYIAIAGFIFTKKHVKKLEKAWHPILKKHGLSYFHMVECAHGNGIFKHLDKDVRSEIQTKLFAILKEHKSAGFAVSFDKRLAHLLPSNNALGIKQVSPYSFCAYWLMLSARRWVDERASNSKIAYYFEAGHNNESESGKIMQSLYKDEWHREHFKIASYNFVNKTYSAAIQTGDILAWLWAKYHKDRETVKRKPREDLWFLIGDEKTYSIDFDEQKILEFIEIINRDSAEASS